MGRSGRAPRRSCRENPGRSCDGRVSGTGGLGDRAPEPGKRRPRTSPDWARTLASGSILFVGGQIVGNAGFFVAVLLLARGLVPADRGTVAFLSTTAVVLARLTGFGVARAASVFAAQRPEIRAPLLSNLMLFTGTAAAAGSAIVCGALAALSEHVPEGIGATELALLGASAVATAVVNSGSSFLVGCTRFRQRALAIMIWPWLYALLVLAVWAGPGLTITLSMLAWAISQAAGAALVLSLCVRGIGFGRPSAPLLRESIAFGLRAWAGSLTQFLNFRLDQVIMGFIATEAALGFYAVAVNVSEVLLLLPGALATAIIPVVARSEPELRADRVLRAFRALVVVTLPSVAIAALLGPVLVPAVFGSAYEDSVVPFLWLVPGAVGLAALLLFSSALTAASAPGLGSLGPTVSLAAGVALDFALIPPLGATGAALAASAAYVAGGIVALLAFRSLHPFALAAIVPRVSDLAALRALGAQAVRRAGFGGAERQTAGP